jgi:hypothetical protein
VVLRSDGCRLPPDLDCFRQDWLLPSPLEQRQQPEPEVGQASGATGVAGQCGLQRGPEQCHRLDQRSCIAGAFVGDHQGDSLLIPGVWVAIIGWKAVISALAGIV